MDQFERGIVTIASGNDFFAQLASNLARSFFLWHPQSAVRFQIATDRPDAFPEDVRRKAVFIPFKQGQYGDCFSPKLHLDKLTLATRETIFLDSDCLIYGSLEGAFDRFRERQVSVLGKTATAGYYWGKIPERMERFKIGFHPIFGGSFYYYQQSDAARAIFERARAIEPHYDEWGFERLRGRPNEEPLMAVAMAEAEQPPVDDDGTIIGHAICHESYVRTNVFFGRTHLVNLPNRHGFDHKWPESEIHPRIVHFNNHLVGLPAYRADVTGLALRARQVPLAGTIAHQLYLPSIRGAEAIKSAVRPLVHKFVGARRVKNKRVAG
jgi:hypothetical protein